MYHSRGEEISQFIKAAAITRAINKRDGWGQFILHTSSQHYDNKLSQVFFDSLDLTEPEYKVYLQKSERKPRFEEMKSEIFRILKNDKYLMRC